MIRELLDGDNIIEEAVESARASTKDELKPHQDALLEVERALQENQGQINDMIKTISSGQARGALFEMLNERATDLKLQRER